MKKQYLIGLLGITAISIPIGSSLINTANYSSIMPVINGASGIVVDETSSFVYVADDTNDEVSADDTIDKITLEATYDNTANENVKIDKNDSLLIYYSDAEPWSITYIKINNYFVNDKDNIEEGFIGKDGTTIVDLNNKDQDISGFSASIDFYHDPKILSGYGGDDDQSKIWNHSIGSDSPYNLSTTLTNNGKEDQEDEIGQVAIKLGYKDSKVEPNAEVTEISNTSATIEYSATPGRDMEGEDAKVESAILYDNAGKDGNEFENQEVDLETGIIEVTGLTPDKDYNNAEIRVQFSNKPDGPEIIEVTDFTTAESSTGLTVNEGISEIIFTDNDGGKKLSAGDTPESISVTLDFDNKKRNVDIADPNNQGLNLYSSIDKAHDEPLVSFSYTQIGKYLNKDQNLITTTGDYSTFTANKDDNSELGTLWTHEYVDGETFNVTADYVLEADKTSKKETIHKSDTKGNIEEEIGTVGARESLEEATTVKQNGDVDLISPYSASVDYEITLGDAVDGDDIVDTPKSVKWMNGTTELASSTSNELSGTLTSTDELNEGETYSETTIVVVMNDSTNNPEAAPVTEFTMPDDQTELTTVKQVGQVEPISLTSAEVSYNIDLGIDEMGDDIVDTPKSVTWMDGENELETSYSTGLSGTLTAAGLKEGGTYTGTTIVVVMNDSTNNPEAAPVTEFTMPDDQSTSTKVEQDGDVNVTSPTSASVDYKITLRKDWDGSTIEDTVTSVKWMDGTTILASSTELSGTLTATGLEEGKTYSETKIVVEMNDDGDIVEDAEVSAFTMHAQEPIATTVEQTSDVNIISLTSASIDYKITLGENEFGDTINDTVKSVKWMDGENKLAISTSTELSGTLTATELEEGKDYTGTTIVVEMNNSVNNPEAIIVNDFSMTIPEDQAIWSVILITVGILLLIGIIIWALIVLYKKYNGNDKNNNDDLEKEVNKEINNVEKELKHINPEVK